MENSNTVTKWAHGVAHDELPYEEALVRLYELRDRYEVRTASELAGSASARHRELYGHRLAFGCCATMETTMRLINKEADSLLAAVTEEISTSVPAYVHDDFEREAQAGLRSQLRSA